MWHPLSGNATERTPPVRPRSVNISWGVLASQTCSMPRMPPETARRECHREHILQAPNIELAKRMQRLRVPESRFCVSGDYAPARGGKRE
ncbi:hypothetical protein AURDEDRAFT_109968 [Auricularia subglabra TFB-10046 SS5]|nr:hypothetical protein AURDEDRAFT_109968 [Auricularia subglabra TFB-10046 SS5]